MEKGYNTDRFLIEKLNNQHNRDDFSCTIVSLDDYIKRQASQDNKKNISVSYILYDQKAEKIAGYYTLSSSTIELNELPADISRKLPHYPLLPAILIGRLAVDLTYQKQGLGEILLIDALKKAKQASLEIASFAVIVDAINLHAIQFYKKYGFISFPSHKDKLYLPMSTIKKL